MPEPVETVWHRTMTPPPYLAHVELDAAPWHRPIQTRAQELDQYEQHRRDGGPRNPDLEQRLFERRQRQVQHHLRNL